MCFIYMSRFTNIYINMDKENKRLKSLLIWN